MQWEEKCSGIDHEKVCGGVAHEMPRFLLTSKIT